MIKFTEYETEKGKEIIRKQLKEQSEKDNKRFNQKLHRKLLEYKKGLNPSKLEQEKTELKLIFLDPVLFQISVIEETLIQLRLAQTNYEHHNKILEQLQLRLDILNEVKELLK